MATQFPGAIDSYVANVDNVDDVMAEDVNELQEAIVAIETKMGETGSEDDNTLEGRTLYPKKMFVLATFPGGGDLALGDAVAITYEAYADGNPMVRASDAKDTLANRFDGICVQAIAATASGLIQVSGVADIPTGAYPVGTKLYIDLNNPGKYSGAWLGLPYSTIFVGVVLGQDRVLLAPDSRRLEELVGVSIGSVSNLSAGDTLEYSGVAWQNQPNFPIPEKYGINLFPNESPSGQFSPIKLMSLVPLQGAEAGDSGSFNGAFDPFVLNEFALPLQVSQLDKISIGLFEANVMALVTVAGAAHLNCFVRAVETQLGTITITGTGTSRTATATDDVFVAGDVGTSILDARRILITGSGVFVITGFTSSKIVTIETASDFVNVSNVGFNMDRDLFDTTGYNDHPIYNTSPGIVKLRSTIAAEIQFDTSFAGLIFRFIAISNDVVTPCSVDMYYGPSQGSYMRLPAELVRNYTPASATNDGYLSLSDFNLFTAKLDPFWTADTLGQLYFPDGAGGLSRTLAPLAGQTLVAAPDTTPTWVTPGGETSGRICVGVGGDYATLKEAVDWFNANATTDTEILISPGHYSVGETITVSNATYNLQIRGLSSNACFLEAAEGLTGTSMFIFESPCDINKLTCDGSTLTDYGTLPGENFITFDTNSGTYSEITDIIINKFYIAVDDHIGSDMFIFNFIISNCAIGIEVDYTTAAITSSIDCEIGDFDNCPIGLNLLKATTSTCMLAHLIFNNPVGGIAIKYTGGAGNFVYAEPFNIFSCTFNRVGTFFNGFDFTNIRDANIAVLGNVGVEDKTPHAKINCIDNTAATTCTTALLPYKVNFTNSPLVYKCKITLANGKMTYQSDHSFDTAHFVAGTLTTGTAARLAHISLSRKLFVSAMTGNGTTITVTTSTPHNMLTGNLIRSLAYTGGTGSFNTAGTPVAITVTGANTFTFLGTGNGTANAGAGTMVMILCTTTVNALVTTGEYSFAFSVYMDACIKNDEIDLVISSTTAGNVFTLKDLTWLAISI